MEYLGILESLAQSNNPSFTQQYEKALKALRRKWIKNFDDNNETIKKILDEYSETFYKLLFDSNNNWISLN